MSAILPTSHSNVRPANVIPGFRITLGFTLLYLSCVVLIPLSGLFIASHSLSWQSFWQTVTTPRVIAAYKITFSMALLAALINTFFGLIIAWTLVRCRLPGRRILDALIDLPFALPTAIAGIALSALYAPHGWLGGLLGHAGIKVAYTPWGIAVALLFVGLPFTVRTVEPVLQDSLTQMKLVPQRTSDSLDERLIGSEHVQGRRGHRLQLLFSPPEHSIGARGLIGGTEND